jgi:uncharacterized protein YjbI with pentapeptide repeats
MESDDHTAQLMKGVQAWNAWRDENPNTEVNLAETNLAGANLAGVDLTKANLTGAYLAEANLTGAYLTDARLAGANLAGANLIEAHLRKADLTVANLTEADLTVANLTEANLTGANLAGVDLTKANLTGACLTGACLTGACLTRVDLTGAILAGANLTGVNLTEANLTRADLPEANLTKANLTGANLTGVNLMAAALVETDLTGADLTGCRLYGVSAWSLKLEGATQQSLVITPPNEPQITVDSIEVAQFIYLLLNNEKIREVIDTITSKVVLILGRFTEERKTVLDALREELRKRDYLPILFDFNVPTTRDITETVSLLARMARFIIADLTDPSSIPKELEAIIPGLGDPVQPLLEGSSRPYAMFGDYWKYEWVLPVYRYEGLEPLLLTLADNVIAPAEGKVKALEERRRVIEAELTEPQ